MISAPDARNFDKAWHKSDPDCLIHGSEVINMRVVIAENVYKVIGQRSRS